MDLISVVIPAHNRSKYIERAILSVIAQDFSNIEIIVVDDGSTDNTVQIAQEYAGRYQNVRLIEHERKKGAQAARNTGISIARGKWIAFLDSDDEWLPGSLSSRYEVAVKHDFQVIHSECYVVRFPNLERKLFGIPALSGMVFREILSKPGPMFQGLLVKKTALEHIGYLDERILSFQEWDTSIRLSQYFAFGFVQEPTFIYHCHGDETISKDRLREARGYEQIIYKHKENIKGVIGRKGLAKHYEVIGRLYKNAGKMKNARRYLLRAFPYTPIGRPYLRAIKNIVDTIVSSS